MGMLNLWRRFAPSAAARRALTAAAVGTALGLGASLVSPAPARAQSVCLPAPRLLTTMPMGGKVGTDVEITITGEELEGATEMYFSDPRLKARPQVDAAGQLVPNKFVVSIAADCPVGAYEARLMTRLGVSASRVFSVGTLAEVVRDKPNTTLATAFELPLNAICNAVMTNRAIDYYAFQAKQGQRVIVDCAARGIDSKLDATVVVADSAGRDLVVERGGGVIDFAVPSDGKYVIKVHELTFNGGPAFYYRLGLWELPKGAPIVRQPSTKPVHAFSWPPTGLPERAASSEVEPNDSGEKAQKISLPCDLAGSFFPAADVDVYEFEAKKGDEWWIEVASERFDLPTDPSLLVQQVVKSPDGEKVTDVVEFNDIPSPVRVSSNGYAYDGPPYNAGTADLMGKLTVPQDGTYRLRVTDLFGGTRSDARNVYRLVVRKAAPDFALVGWALHMELRNGDRNALSKPMALRGGATMALEVVAVRRDGFNGPIDLAMEGLPEGVTATGLRIPAGQSRGILLVTARQDAPRGFANAKFVGRASIDGATVERPCRLASMAWPIRDAWGELPRPRLLADVPVSVGGVDQAPLTITSAAREPLTAKVGQTLAIPLTLTRRSEFSGATMQMRTLGAGFEGVPQFDVALTSDSASVSVDLAKLKTAPGDYVIAFHGGAVAKYRHRLDQLTAAEAARQKAQQEVAALESAAKKLTQLALQATPEKKAEAEKAIADATARLQKAAAAVAATEMQVKAATAAAAPQEIVDIIVTEPIVIRVQPAEAP